MVWPHYRIGPSSKCLRWRRRTQASPLPSRLTTTPKAHPPCWLQLNARLAVSLARPACEWPGWNVPCGRPPLTRRDPAERAPEATDIRLRILAAPVQRVFQDSVFGFAVHPVLASVYYDHALRRAKSDDAEFGVPIILGCVIAHELGHLLLGSNGHSDTGIMQPRWEANQVRQLMTGTLLFTSEQSKAMRVEAGARIEHQKNKLTSASSSLQD